MADFTRRTHIVRCPADPESPDDVYADVEVLDALAFRTDMGKELVLRFDKKDIDPYIVDNTGGGHGRTPSKGTRRSHMERVKTKDGLIDVEVLDVVSFRGPGGDEWILDFPSKKSSGFSKNGGSPGSAPFTRRMHKEKISDPFGESKPDRYMTILRTDEIAFRTIGGKEMIIKMPSSDDGGKRASTFVTSPKGYDPANEDGPKPPINKDKNVYVSFPKDGSPFTGDEKISQGMLWWIRKIKGGGTYIRIDIIATSFAYGAFPPPATITFDFEGSNAKDATAKLIDSTSETKQVAPPPAAATTVYFVWNGFAPFPTQDNFDNIVTPNGGAYAAQFAYEVLGPTDIPRPNLLLLGNGDIHTGGPYLGSGFFENMAAASFYAGAFNFDYSGHRPGAEGPQGQLGGYWKANGVITGSITDAVVFATSLNVTGRMSPSKTVLKSSYLIQIPTKETVISVKVDLGSAGSVPRDGTISFKAYGYSDCPTMKVVTDAGVFPEGGGDLTPADATAPDNPIDPPDVVTSKVFETKNFKVTTEVLKQAVPPALKPHHVQIVINDRSTPDKG